MPTASMAGNPVNRIIRDIYLWAILIIIGGMKTGVFTPTEAAVVAAFYALAVAWATALFAWNKNQIAGALTATFPLALLIYFAVFGFPNALAGNDRYIVLGIVALWALYAWRLVRIAAAYPSMIDPPDGPKSKPRRRHPDYFHLDKDEK